MVAAVWGNWWCRRSLNEVRAEVLSSTLYNTSRRSTSSSMLVSPAAASCASRLTRDNSLFTLAMYHRSLCWLGRESKRAWCCASHSAEALATGKRARPLAEQAWRMVEQMKLA